MTGDAIVLYTSSEHLNSMSMLASFIAKHHPSISLIILCTAPASAAASIAAVPSITYHRLQAPTLPPHGNTADIIELFFEIPRHINPELRKTLLNISLTSRIRALVLDFFCNSALEVSRSLSIPTYYYLSSGGYCLCQFLYIPTTHETVPQDIGSMNSFLQIPGCPPIHSSDIPIPLWFRESNTYKHFLNTAVNMRESDGILVNSFDALELKAKTALAQGLCTPNAKTPPVYYVGPLIQEKNSKNGVGDEHACLKWLDLQPSKSVIYLCFGRRGLFSAEQVMEMARGLESSGHRFLWAVRSPPGKREPEQTEDPDLNVLLPEGFLERTNDRGFVLTSFAPQLDILSHDSVAGFVTHCGRSSLLESISCGVPMIGWPIYAEQKMNRVFMVEEMKVALPLKADAGGFVTAVELEKRVRELIESDAGEEIRRKVEEMKNAGAASAVKGGSSVVDLGNFIKNCLK